MKSQIILINGKNPLTETGGYQTYTYNLAKILTCLGYDVTIYCFGKKNEVIQSSVGTIKTIYSKLFYLPFLKSIEISGLLILGPRLAWSIKLDSSPTIVWGIGPWSFSAAILKLFNKNITFFSFYPTTFKHEFKGTLSGLTFKDHGVLLKLEAILASITIIPFYTLCEKFFLRLSDKIIIHYASAKRILELQFSIPPNKLIKIADYLETFKKNAGMTKVPNLDKPLILLIARHDGRKGINFLLHAFSILNKLNIKYQVVIIGKGKLFNAHRNLAKNLGLKNVKLLGFVSEIEPFLKIADLYVFPSIEEGSSSLSILEAMRHSLPIVSTNVDGIPEDLKDQKSALLIPPKNPQAFATAIQKLIEDPGLARSLGIEAKKKFNQKHNFKKVKSQLNFFITTYNTQ